ncbi:zf-TFIIB domain-containing protein [Azonexus sp.]|uniref:TFIIB-type zinc ribbon-containing protein n=1 Tax=Azonexus sp. TaxID=1872668 RepID=UPI0027B9958B|nr:zf-TFIIB domain-containing protein [Azonexus sp.]
MKPTPCPSCRQAAEKHSFERKLGGKVVLDLCFPCQGIWFDENESVQITPGGIIELFRLIHEHRDNQRLPLSSQLHCPRCNERLLHGLDIVKPGGKFNYHRCLQQHGRFITFGQFMIEKGFVRQLTRVEVNTLATQVGSVHCTGCGAPVDIRTDHACRHCGAAIAILDRTAIEQALARYQHAEIQRSKVDVEALGNAIVLREREKSRLARDRMLNREVDEIAIGDLIVSGIELLGNIFRR